MATTRCLYFPLSLVFFASSLALALPVSPQRQTSSLDSSNQARLRMLQVFSHLEADKELRPVSCPVLADGELCSSATDPVLCSSSIDTNMGRFASREQQNAARRFCAVTLFPHSNPAGPICFQELWLPMLAETSTTEEERQTTMTVSLIQNGQSVATRLIEPSQFQSWLKIDVVSLDQFSEDQTRANRSSSSFEVCGSVQFDRSKSPFTVTGHNGNDQSFLEALQFLPDNTRTDDTRMRRSSKNSYEVRDDRNITVSENDLSGKARGSCTLTVLRINLKQDLGLKNVLFPTLINFNYCGGRCLKRYQRTNGLYKNKYAEVKAKLRGSNRAMKRHLSRSHCVATSFSPVTILFRTGFGFKSLWFDEFAAKGCGCS